MSLVSPIVSPEKHYTIVVLGASGDLAKKKTFPALFGLFKFGFLPSSTTIIGYARTEMSNAEFQAKIASGLKTANEEQEKQKQEFISKLIYLAGAYDQSESFQKLAKLIEQNEEKSSNSENLFRVFYLALPPSVFVSVAQCLRSNVYSNKVTQRLVIEKPFGKDYDSAKALLSSLAGLFKEEEMFRIDHYLGKEMVKNLMVLRFANVFFSSCWSREFIDNIQITFKETIGTEGRGGYFDEFGIIRDVMQNHLLQILCIVAMERPASLSAEDVRDEKVIVGQFTESEDKTKKGYLDDPTVPKGSFCPTYAAAALYITNERWDGVPFILKCGKALNEQKAEIRIQFRDLPGSLFKNVSRNELVIRVQPNESVYAKMMVKKPGHSTNCVVSEMDLSYSNRYKDLRIPDAYEALLLDVLRDDRSNFVRDDELLHAWKIFTPVLHQLEKVKPIPYAYGSRGPSNVNEFVANHGFRRDSEYEWKL